MTNTVEENKETRSAFLLGGEDVENDDEDDKEGGLRRESSFADEGIVCLEWGPTETKRRPSLELSAIVLVVVLEFGHVDRNYIFTESVRVLFLLKDPPA